MCLCDVMDVIGVVARWLANYKVLKHFLFQNYILLQAQNVLTESFSDHILTSEYK